MSSFIILTSLSTFFATSTSPRQHFSISKALSAGLLLVRNCRTPMKKRQKEETIWVCALGEICVILGYIVDRIWKLQYWKGALLSRIIGSCSCF